MLQHVTLNIKGYNRPHTISLRATKERKRERERQTDMASNKPIEKNKTKIRNRKEKPLSVNNRASRQKTSKV